MRFAWCTAHRGVMRIAFFEPPMPHFYDPCPRCQNSLKYQNRENSVLDVTVNIQEKVTEETICQFLDEKGK